MKAHIGSLAIVTTIGLFSLAGCGGGKVIVMPATAQTPVVVPVQAAVPSGAMVMTDVPAIPPRPTNYNVVTTASPGPGYVYVEGYYNWNGSRYDWVPSGWVRTPAPTAVWQPAHWQRAEGGYVWVGGAWRY
jgi:hypothetical protein